MKYGTKTLFRHGLAVAIGVGILCASGVAQDATLPPEAATSAATTEAMPEESDLQRKVREYKLDIDLKGKRTRVTEFLELIQKQVPTPLNIVVSRDGSSLMVPPMRLKNVSVQAVLNAVEEASEGELNWHFGDDKELIIVQSDEGYGSDTSETIEVVNASRILENTEQASLLSAIEIGMELRGSSQENVTVKLHKETKLLFIKGIYEDIEIIRKILVELGGPAPKRQPSGGFMGGSGGPASGFVLPPTKK